METIETLFKGKIIAVKLNKHSQLPKSAKLSFCDHLDVESWAFTSVDVYYTSTKKGLKYYAVIKDERNYLNK